MKRCQRPTGQSSVLIELQSRRVKVNRRAGRAGMKDTGGEGRGGNGILGWSRNGELSGVVRAEVVQLLQLPACHVGRCVECSTSDS